MRLGWGRADNMLEALDTNDWLPIYDADRDLPLDLVIKIGPLEDGRPACTGLIIGLRYWGSEQGLKSEPTEITSRLLREIPLQRIVEAVIDAQPPSFEFPTEYPRVKRRKQRHRRPGRAGIDPERLEEFCNAYRAERKRTPRRGIAPLLARRFNMSESTARRWMKRCDDTDHEQGEGQ
jgi:hypothetical protein